MMSLLSQQVSILVGLRATSNKGPEVVRQHGEARKAAVLSCVEKHGPIGETEVASRTGLLRTCVHNHLMELAKMRKIQRASEKPRAPWVVFKSNSGRLVTFETEEDQE